MATNLKNAIIQWCVEHKIPSKINLGVLVIALVELLSLITIWCSLGIPDGCREVIRAAPIGKIGSILITLMVSVVKKEEEFYNHGGHGSRLAWSSPDICAEERSSEGSRADCEAVERTSRNAAKWTQGTEKG